MNRQETQVMDAGRPGALERAAALLRQGELVALPTETVYGLAGCALSPPALRRIYAVKGRPPSNPLIVHVASKAGLRTCAAGWSGALERLAEAFWPGPLTLVARRSSRVPDEATGGGGTVALRWPSHPAMQAAIRACGFPLAAPSANLSNRLSPTTARHVLEQLGGSIPLILDGGECQVGIESTVVDMVSDPPAILRPGMLHLERLRTVVPEIRGPSGEDAILPRSPGAGAVHYSPRAELRVCRWSSRSGLEALACGTGLSRERIAVVACSAPPGSGWAHAAVLPADDPEAFAQRLYAELHRCDQARSLLILMEAPPQGSRWEGIRDRIARAAPGSRG